MTRTQIITVRDPRMFQKKKDFLRFPDEGVVVMKGSHLRQGSEGPGHCRRAGKVGKGPYRDSKCAKYNPTPFPLAFTLLS